MLKIQSDVRAEMGAYRRTVAWQPFKFAMLPNFLSYGAPRQEEDKLQNSVPHCQDTESRKLR